MFGSKKKPRIDSLAIGQKFQKSDAPLVIWEIERLFTGTDGTAYAQITRIDDPSMRKTVAQEALERGTQYIRLGESALA